MIRVLSVNFLKAGLAVKDFAGLSTDTKPTEGLATGSSFIEVNTKDVYLFDEESSTWKKV